MTGGLEICLAFFAACQVLKRHEWDCASPIAEAVSYNKKFCNILAE